MRFHHGPPSYPFLSFYPFPFPAHGNPSANKRVTPSHLREERGQEQRELQYSLKAMEQMKTVNWTAWQRSREVKGREEKDGGNVAERKKKEGEREKEARPS